MLFLMSSKGAGHDLLLIASKYRTIIQLGDRLSEVKYNKISQLGSVNSDRDRLMEVTALKRSRLQ